MGCIQQEQKKTEENQQVKHIMIDLETLGSDVNTAPVISIAAIRFGVDEGVDSLRNAFYRNIDLSDALRYGNVDAGTLKWWLKSDTRDVFLDILYDKRASSTHNALAEFADWVRLTKGVIPWSRGMDFDFPILDRLFKSTSIATPFSQFWKKRDVRTLLDTAKFAGVNLEIERTQGEAHNALSDVVHQANEVVANLRALSELRASL